MKKLLIFLAIFVLIGLGMWFALKKQVVVNEVNLKLRELPYPKGLFNTLKDFKSIKDFKFLNLTQASYIIYGRHSELAQAKYWDSPQKIRYEINKELLQKKGLYLRLFKIQASKYK